MFSLRNKRRLMKKSVNLNKYGPFFIIFPLPVMLKFTVYITGVHLFTCVAKAVTSRRSRELELWFWTFGAVCIHANIAIQLASRNFRAVNDNIK